MTNEKTKTGAIRFGEYVFELTIAEDGASGSLWFLILQSESATAVGDTLCRAPQPRRASALIDSPFGLGRGDWAALDSMTASAGKRPLVVN